MPHSYSASMVPSADMLTFPGEGERSVRALFPEVVVNGTAKMTDTGGSRLIFSNPSGGHDVIGSSKVRGGGLRRGGAGSLDGGGSWCPFRAMALGGVCAESESRVEKWEAALKRWDPSSGLQHREA